MSHPMLPKAAGLYFLTEAEAKEVLQHASSAGSKSVEDATQV